ncbi:MAG: YitT family protein [Proteobacteria bacterium]|nr:YitT family protein [Pseudomonadota bacterium]
MPKPLKFIWVSKNILILLGIIFATIGLKGFLLPNGFFDGGAMGISLLLNHFINIDLSIFIVLVNIPFVLMGIKQISLEFALKSAIAIVILALAVHSIHIPAFTQDKLLIAVFGGVFLGLGIGLTIRGGAVIDGTEVLAVQISRKSSLSVGDFIALFNFILFIGVAFLLNFETAMYSMLTYVSASKSVDFVLNGIEEYIGVTIISPKFEKIRKMLTNELQRGVTVYKTEGGYGKKGHDTEERKALFCAVTRLEVTQLLSAVELIDPEAFIIQHSIKDTRGGMIKKRPLH